jgi:acetoin utilization deacetylase AcuC-like enzyme
MHDMPLEKPMRYPIIYHPLLSPTWKDFGILIPLSGKRSEKVFQSLNELGNNIKELDLKLLTKISKAELTLAHDELFIENLYSKKLFKEFTDCFELIDENGNFNRYDPDNAIKDLSEFMDEILFHVAGTCYAIDQSLKEGFCYFLGGGMHHARKDKGAGFCILNDIVLGIKRAQDQKKIKSCWVIDVDAHKGDGTAHMTVDDASILTLSLHMEKGWPLDHPDPNHPSKVPSTIDIEINSKNCKNYNKLLSEGLEKLLVLQGKTPDLMIINNGADPYEHDELPSTSLLKLSKEELLERDQILFNFAKLKNIPQTWVMSGGYGERSYEIYVQFLDWVLKSNS